MGSLLAFLVSLLRAIPALEQLTRTALAERDKEREREAQRRQVAKDAAVDAAIDAPAPVPGEDQLLLEVRKLLALMSQIDPTGGQDRHPEWPIKITTDSTAGQELAATLNRLQALAK